MDLIVVNSGISNPLCSKNGFICFINGLTAASIIVSTILRETGFSNSFKGYTVIEPLSANSQTILYCILSTIMLV